MTEEEWLSATEAGPDWPDRLEFLRMNGAWSPRKCRLFAVACCRHVWQLLRDERSRQALEIAERYADRMATVSEFKSAGKMANAATQVGPRGRASGAALSVLSAVDINDRMESAAHFAAFDAVNAVGNAARGKLTKVAAVMSRENQWQGVVFRDIFGNPFRPVTFIPGWRTPAVTNLAQAIYDERHLPSGRFDNQRMGILADALEEYGCDNGDNLGHLRCGGEHVRGCWVIDHVRGKE